MATTKEWVAGARPRTLPAALVPVAIASGASGSHFVWDRAALALVVSLAIQIATNYANDYSDGKRGTDDVRVGPMRLVASKKATPKQVLLAAMVFFGVAGVAGGVLALIAAWWLLIVGALAILAGWYYTGGKHPYGYLGLGEVFVFVFFGLVAVLGTYYVQVSKVDLTSVVLGCASGFLAVALLVINNLRDIPTDKASGKATLAVRMGDTRTRRFYVGLMVMAVLLPLLLVGTFPYLLILLILLIPLWDPIKTVLNGAKGRDLIAVLGKTGRLQILFGLLATLALALK